MRNIRRRCRLLRDWENCLRKGTPCIEPWSDKDIREMMAALATIEQDDELLPMLPHEIQYVRRLRRLCLRSLDRGNVSRADRLAGRVMRPLADALHKDDMRLAEELSSFRSGRPKGAYKRIKRAVKEVIQANGGRMKPNEVARELRGNDYSWIKAITHIGGSKWEIKIEGEPNPYYRFNKIVSEVNGDLFPKK